MWPFFNPTIEVVTFHLNGWCMLGVFLLPAFTRLEHKRHDLLSRCHGMHVCTDQTSVYALILGGMESEPMLTPRENSPELPENVFPEEDQTHDAASSRTESPTYYQRAIPAPLFPYNPWDRLSACTSLNWQAEGMSQLAHSLAGSRSWKAWGTFWATADHITTAVTAGEEQEEQNLQQSMFAILRRLLCSYLLCTINHTSHSAV